MNKTEATVQHAAEETLGTFIAQVKEALGKAIRDTMVSGPVDREMIAGNLRVFHETVVKAVRDAEAILPAFTGPVTDVPSLVPGDGAHGAHDAEHKTTTRQTTETATRRGFPGLKCFECGNADCVTLGLDDVTGESAFKCEQCESTWDAGDAKQVAQQWLQVVTWVRLAPRIDD